MKNSFILLAILAVTGATWFTWHTHRQTARFEMQLRALQIARQLTDEKIRATAAHLAQSEKSGDDLRARLKAASASAQKKDPPTPATRTALPDPTRLIADNPHLQFLQSAARRAQLAITYGPFYRAAGLSAPQIAAFERNLLDREERQSDLFATASAHQTALSDHAFQKILADLETEYQASQRTALGDSAASQLAAYEGTARAREIVSGLAGAAAMAGLPLDAPEAERLTRAIVAATRPADSSGADAAGLPVDWTAVHGAAKSFLTPAQLTFIETTEASGPRGSGGRFLPALQTAIEAAAKEDAAAPATPGSP